jgi:hypothetical protein
MLNVAMRDPNNNRHSVRLQAATPRFRGSGGRHRCDGVEKTIGGVCTIRVPLMVQDVPHEPQV